MLVRIQLLPLFWQDNVDDLFLALSWSLDYGVEHEGAKRDIKEVPNSLYIDVK